MAYRAKHAVSFIGLLLATGCDPVPSRKPPNEKSASDPIVRDVARAEAEVRIMDADKRIDELEREVGELKSTPEKLDLELLTARVTALEIGRSNVADGTKSFPPNAAVDPVSPAKPTDRSNSIAPGGAKRASSFNLPALEPRARLATQAEVREFTRGSRAVPK